MPAHSPALAAGTLRVHFGRDLREIFTPHSRYRGMEHPQDQDRAQHCLEAAKHCEERATSTKEPTAQATFAEAARCWRELARCWDELARR